ncbi:hypothetical protein Mapa_009327 [Marchantia paleacea]|nr:hypothetical protein Mapa_009327 [Marchantia paleacea]
MRHRSLYLAPHPLSNVVRNKSIELETPRVKKSVAKNAMVPSVEPRRKNACFFPAVGRRLINLVYFARSRYKNLEGFGFFVHNHAHRVQAEGRIEHGRQFSPLLCQRVAHHKSFPSIVIASEADKTSCSGSRKEYLIAW